MRIRVTCEMKKTMPEEMIRAGRALGFKLIELRVGRIASSEPPTLWVAEFEPKNPHQLEVVEGVGE